MPDGIVPEGEQSPISENNPKMFVKWADQEIDQFVNPFSFNNFELVEPEDDREKGYVKVKLPATAEPMARGLIRAHLDLVEAFETPLEKRSQEKIGRFIGDTANVANTSETEEAEWIEAFGRFFDVAAMMAGRPDPALEVLKSQSRQLAHEAVAKELSFALRVANAFAWDNFMDAQREKYKTPEEISEAAKEVIIAQYENYQKINKLMGDPEVGELPRFVIVNSTGKEMFRSTADLRAS